MAMENAVMVRNAKKGYGAAVTILNGLNVNVPRGCIYSLLGASGCGKTTLLSCVVGVRKLDSGDIWVLGGKPGTKECGIPGPRIGYMPQDVSLIGEFSLFDALQFFGRISGMENYEIGNQRIYTCFSLGTLCLEERYIELKDLLQLPPRNRLVKNMSGGQQRRVSFAAALLQRPELLILDEPTVGLDPVLRDKQIGLLRNGQLLAESSPNELLTRFQTDSLEEAFLTLSQQQQEQSRQENINSISSPSGGINPIYNSQKFYDNYEQAKNRLNNKRDAVGIMHFKKNFSLGMQEKIENMVRMSDDLISAAAIYVTLHTPNREIALFATQKLYKMFNNDFEKIVEECGLHKKYAHLPIKFEKPIYGKEDQNYGEYVIPVFLLTLLFFLPTSVSSSTIITDRDSGIWNRILVQGEILNGS
ncbi:hypothetical protein E2986_00857 [Frieseomelitta varia]|uniref:ABC transporter domain-containing protein n=1 Tax=Frieseomelitta varia TaxID=561572 RepID=A0A833SBN1_9HYME|nr:hypothetical protein E2986_00857 [Frieseomelitta varia]